MQKKSLLVLLTALFVLSACQSSQVKSIHNPTEQLTLQASYTPISITPSATTEQKSPEIKNIILPTQTPTYRVNIMAVGDIMLGRTIGDRILKEGYEVPFLYTAETLSTADLTLGNLECPISNLGQAVQKKYVFRAPDKAAKSLSYAGFDILSLGNNHSLDYGTEALLNTISNLNSEKIHAIGAGRDDNEAYQPLFLSVNGIRLAFLSFVDVPTTDFDYLIWEAGPDQPGIAWAHPEKVAKGVRLAKEEADIVIVMLHNGYEFWQKVSDRQQEIAKLAIDNGATLVIGSHSHVLQRIETYKDGLIAYSMGNFVFDNFLFPPNYSAILSVNLTPKGIESYERIDVVISLEGIPQIMPYTIEE